MSNISNAKRQRPRMDGGHHINNGEMQKQCFKTSMCSFYEKGKCNKGDSCSYAHTQDQLNKKPDFKKTRMCSAWEGNRCAKTAERCDFAHGLDDLKAVSPSPQRLPSPEPATIKAPSSDDPVAPLRRSMTPPTRIPLKPSAGPSTPGDVAVPPLAENRGRVTSILGPGLSMEPQRMRTDSFHRGGELGPHAFPSRPHASSVQWGGMGVPPLVSSHVPVSMGPQTSFDAAYGGDEESKNHAMPYGMVNVHGPGNFPNFMASPADPIYDGRTRALSVQMMGTFPNPQMPQNQFHPHMGGLPLPAQHSNIPLNGSPNLQFNQMAMTSFDGSYIYNSGTDYRGADSYDYHRSHPHPQIPNLMPSPNLMTPHTTETPDTFH